MIINAEKKLNVTVELSKKDIQKILKGRSIMRSTRHDKDEPTVVEIYCSEPDETDYDE